MFLGSEGVWPLPFTRYTTNNGDRSIAFQSDRFSIAWDFDPDSPRYPGFDKLFDELNQKFAGLVSELSNAGITVNVRGSRCDYTNELDNIPPAAAAVGILTDWEAQPSRRVASASVVDLHMHPCDAQEEHGCNAAISVQSRDAKTILRLAAERSSDNDPDAELGGLQAAHDELVDLFLDFTTSNQRERWMQR
jgi:hypothetical protein